MRYLPALLALIALVLPASARADTLEIPANRPRVAVQINGQPANLIVDPTLPDVVVLNQASATRLRVRTAPFAAIKAVSDDVSITGKIALPNVTFANGKRVRSKTGVFPGRYFAEEDLDGAIGPGALPYDQVRIVLKQGAPGSRALVYKLKSAALWYFEAPLTGKTAQISFRLDRNETILSRPATRLLDTEKLLTPAGDVVTLSYPFGLSTRAQPVTTTATAGGFGFGPTFARTAAPLVASDGTEVTVVAESKKKPEYNVSLGRAAIAACSDMVWVKSAKSLTLHCE